MVEQRTPNPRGGGSNPSWPASLSVYPEDFMSDLFKFFNEVKGELQRVEWPSREEFFEMLVAVGIVVFFFSVVLAGMDFGFSFLLKKVMS